MTLPGKNRLESRIAELSVLIVLLSTITVAQASSDTPTSSVVSNPATSAEPVVVKSNRSLITPLTSDAIVVDPSTLLPDLPPVPRSNATLIGGTIGRLDRVRDQVTVNIFGGGRTTVLFDPRTKVYRGPQEVSIADLREGERAYLDTILDGSTVFARAIRLSSRQAVGESQGVVVKYREDRGELTIRDGISPNPVRIRVNGTTKFTQDAHTVPASTLTEGSLISVAFSSEGNGRDTAREISILALPGARFTFSGQVLHIDLRSGLLVIKSSTDQKTYEIYLDPATPPNDGLHTGVDVTVVANFQDSRYVARNIALNPEAK